jgi:hypothetical protein
MRYVENLCIGARFIVGAETPEQIRNNCHTHATMAVVDRLCEEWDKAWPEDDARMVNPSRWPQHIASK